VKGVSKKMREKKSMKSWNGVLAMTEVAAECQLMLQHNFHEKGGPRPGWGYA